MKRYFIYLMLAAVAGHAQIPAGYYNSAQGLNGNNLKIALHNIIKNHTQITYNGLWTAYPKTDRKANGKVWDMYSDVPNGTPPYEYTFVTSQCGNYNSEGDCYNREHSWPKSWFNDQTGPISDLFHIYPTDGKVNGVRDNYPYGDVNNPTWTSQNGGKLGPCVDAGYNQTVFEPIDEYKGDLARGYFYMSVRYYSEDGAWSTSDATNKSTILPWQLAVLLQWNQQDPVSLKEKSRNDSVYYRFQNNRNPFIDHPEWADSIWGTSVSTFIKEVELSSSFSLYPNPSNNVVNIVMHTSNPDMLDIRVQDLSGRLVEETKMDPQQPLNLDCSSWNKGVYFISIKNSRSVSNLKFVKE